MPTNSLWSMKRPEKKRASTVVITNTNVGALSARIDLHTHTRTHTHLISIEHIKQGGEKLKTYVAAARGIVARLRLKNNLHEKGSLHWRCE